MSGASRLAGGGKFVSHQIKKVFGIIGVRGESIRRVSEQCLEERHNRVVALCEHQL